MDRKSVLCLQIRVRVQLPPTRPVRICSQSKPRPDPESDVFSQSSTEAGAGTRNNLQSEKQERNPTPTSNTTDDNCLRSVQPEGFLLIYMTLGHKNPLTFSMLA